METERLQKAGGISAILESLIYISTFIFYGGILTLPNIDADVSERFNFLVENQITLSILNFTSYVLFGIVLAVLVLAIHQRLKVYSKNFVQLTSIFGFIWVGLVIASGMIQNIALNSVINIGNENPENAMQIWKSVSIITEGIGGGNEIVGGLWVLLLSTISFKGQLFTKSITYIGFIVGIAGILTVFPLDIFAEIFGISQIIWFIAIGVFMIKNPSAPPTIQVLDNN